MVKSSNGIEKGERPTPYSAIRTRFPGGRTHTTFCRVRFCGVGDTKGTTLPIIRGHDAACAVESKQSSNAIAKPSTKCYSSLLGTEGAGVRIFKTKWFTRLARKEDISDKKLSEAVQEAEKGLQMAIWAETSSRNEWHAQARVKEVDTERLSSIAQEAGLCSCMDFPRAPKPT